MAETSKSNEVISVVIPTRNRWESLNRCLTALVEQEAKPESFQIIVVDNGSRDATKRMVARHSNNNGPRLIYLRTERCSPAAARNRGIARAEGQIIAFTDDDCVPDANWLATIRQSLNAHPDWLGVGGITYSEPEKITPFTHQVEDALPYSFPSCNAAYRKTALAAVGGFDEAYAHPSNEDWDLVFALQAQGEIGFEPLMRVCHPPRPNTFAAKVLRMEYLVSEFRLYHKFPKQYRASVHRNPWRVILYHQGLVQAALQLRRHARWGLAHPVLFLKFIALLLTQRMYLVLLLPSFWSAQKRFAVKDAG